MIYQPTCPLLGHAFHAIEQLAFHESLNELALLRNKWRRGTNIQKHSIV